MSTSAARKIYGMSRPCGNIIKYRQGGCRCDLCRVVARDAQREYRKNNPEIYKAQARRSHIYRYGITPDDYDRMHLEQQGVCAICHLVCGSKNRLSIDHDHRTNKVRGLLCYSCNIKLGWFEKYPEQVLAYLYKDTNGD